MNIILSLTQITMHLCHQKEVHIFDKGKLSSHHSELTLACDTDKHLLNCHMPCCVQGRGLQRRSLQT